MGRATHKRDILLKRVSVLATNSTTLFFGKICAIANRALFGSGLVLPYLAPSFLGARRGGYGPRIQNKRLYLSLCYLFPELACFLWALSPWCGFAFATKMTVIMRLCGVEKNGPNRNVSKCVTRNQLFQIMFKTAS